jgi:hypothetical protein
MMFLVFDCERKFFFNRIFYSEEEAKNYITEMEITDIENGFMPNNYYSVYKIEEVK